MSGPKHFLTLSDLTSDELRGIISRANELKIQQREGIPHARYPGKVLAMLFAKASTRTRVSFEVGMRQLGGSALFLSSADTQLGRGEPVEDTARVLSSMVDLVMIRTHDHGSVERFADVASVPVINGLTDDYHPCQLLADMQTWFEHRGDIQGRRVCWLGDGNNMCHSYINAARLLDFELVVACPDGYQPASQLVSDNSDRVHIVHDPREAVLGADLLVTDVWASMGQEDEQQARSAAMAPYQLNRELLALAAPEALYMHCLPAHRDEEISSELMAAPETVIWDEAENRLHAQKALIEFLLG
ncbi:MAG: ornithine carbamoyltransferase [Luminiphilus sp.]|nr:ornithine carbamoyltransferase [Luminiphilus sp.]